MVIEGKHPAVDATISPSLEPAVQIAECSDIYNLITEKMFLN